MKATTPKGKQVSVITEHFGTARIETGKLFYGTVRVAFYDQGSRNTTGAKTLKDALIEADKIIDELGLIDDEVENS